MTRQEYEQKREQEWRAFCNRHGIIDRGHVILFSAFFDAFDRAYALGKQEGPSKNSSEIKRELSKNSSESNPAEPKFNLGDKAILKGYVCTITSIVYEQGKFVGYKIESPLLHGIATVPESDLEPYTEPKNEVVKMKPIKSRVSVYLATKEEDEEFRTLLYKNGFMWSSGTALISLSNWVSAHEASHIHFVYHDKTVTYMGERTEETLTFTEFKKRYFGEDVNLSQETVNCDKQFDNILKDGFHDHNRLHIASIIMSGLLASGKEKHPVRRALDLADALIAKCDKEGGEE